MGALFRLVYHELLQVGVFVLIMTHLGYTTLGLCSTTREEAFPTYSSCEDLHSLKLCTYSMLRAKMFDRKLPSILGSSPFDAPDGDPT